MKVLSVEQVGVNDNFFDLGGHSIAATRVVFHLIDLFQIQLPLRTFFESPTVAQMAAALTAHEAQPGRLEKIARVLRRIEAMSAEEVQIAIQHQQVKKGTA